MPNTFRIALAKLIKSGWKDYVGADARSLSVTFKVSGVASELWLEQLAEPRQYGKLALADGTATAKVAPGHYVLEFRGKTATPSEAYEIEVTAPPSAKWKPTPAKRSDQYANVLGVHTTEVV